MGLKSYLYRVKEIACPGSATLSLPFTNPFEQLSIHLLINWQIGFYAAAKLSLILSIFSFSKGGKRVPIYTSNTHREFIHVNISVRKIIKLMEH